LTLVTNQPSLKGLLTHAYHTPEQQKWPTKLLRYNFNIIYKPNFQNQVANFLPWPQTSLFLAISSPVANITIELRNCCQSDKGQKEVQQLTSLLESEYKFLHGLLYHRHPLLLPSIGTLRSTVLNEFHATSFFWPHMYRDTKIYIKECLPSQKNKPMNQKPLGLFQPILTPTKL